MTNFCWLAFEAFRKRIRLCKRSVIPSRSCRTPAGCFWTLRSGASRCCRFFRRARIPMAGCCIRPRSSMRRGQSSADILEEQNRTLGAGERVLANISRLRSGANAVVTGQQVTLFGGPLYTLLKAATAIRKAHDATAAGTSARPHFLAGYGRPRSGGGRPCRAAFAA